MSDRLVGSTAVDDAQPHVLMVAAECRDLAKVGGLGDVVRDLSQALHALGVPISVAMPGYERAQPGGELVTRFPVPFGPRHDWPVEVFRRDLGGVPVHLLRSEEFFGGANGDVYIDSDRLGRGPFEDDAQRFAFFSTALLEFMHRHAALRDVTALHCHDWHTAVMLVLLRHDPRHGALARSIRTTLFTIHNLDYQGVRPFEVPKAWDLRSFAGWFPTLYADLKREGDLGPLGDPYTPEPCFNPMRAGINLAGAVNSVSPRYAVEITQPDDPTRNFIGGRGLSPDLRRRAGSLSGILNGLDYRVHDPGRLVPPFDVGIEGWPEKRLRHKALLLRGLSRSLEDMAARLGEGFKNREAVLRKTAALQPGEWLDRPLVVAVTRAVRQKASILLEAIDGPRTVLGEMLARDLFLLVLGTGELEARLESINAFPNGLFVCAFDPRLAGQLYAAGDVFLMPSDFEPCGISQMIAMRHGCLPLVADVGGLSDTVQDMQTGFVYRGATRPAARQALLDTLDKALRTWAHDRDRWLDMQARAMSARFEWTSSARRYLDLYRGPKQR